LRAVNRTPGGAVCPLSLLVKTRYSSLMKTKQPAVAALGNQILKEILAEGKVAEQTKKRARCEENWAELVVAVVLSDRKINTKDDILNHDLAIKKPAYVMDLNKRPGAVVYQYIQNFKRQIESLDLNIVEVYILGKNQKINPEIEKLQKGLDRKEKKSDVMVKLVDGSFVGFSVKSGKGDTLTNYAIEKFLPDAKQLKECRLRKVREAGLPEVLDKSRRDEYNDLFRGENDYHSQLIDAVMANKESVLNQWAMNLFPDIPFLVYSFDGDKLRVNTYQQVKDTKFDLKPIPCPAKKPRGNGPAKTFFEVSENGCPSYIWDVRWKGSVLASPQILTHRIH
jgi:hypothetical protein